MSNSMGDRKSTRLNSSHLGISYAVFCLRKEEHTSELQSLRHLLCRLLLEIDRTTGEDVDSHTVLDRIRTFIIAIMQRISSIGCHEARQKRGSIALCAY